MLRLEQSMAPALSVGAVDVRRWDEFELTEPLPFFAMWYSVPPGQTSPRDQHPEVELSIVVAGIAHVESDSGQITTVQTGESFLLSRSEGHVVHNRSAEPLTIFSAYWWPDAAAAAQELNLINKAADDAANSAAEARSAS